MNRDQQNRQSNFGQGVEDEEELAEEYIDVGDREDFYENVQPSYTSRQMLAPKLEYQQPASSTYFVPRLSNTPSHSQQMQYGSPAIRTPGGSTDYPSAMEVKSTVLRPASVYSRPNNALNTRIAGLPQSILASSLNSGKPKQKKSQGNKKHCNCTKSQCLKLYCDCFANGEFCTDCNCKDCHNNLQNENERSRAIKNSLARNPHAFNPKIGVASKAGKSVIDLERLHQKGCHCKKSNCLKNYCECYEAKVSCTDRCKCCSCRNTEADRSTNFKDKFSATTLQQLAAAASKNRDGTPESDEEQDGLQEEPDPKTQPWYYMSDDVIEATVTCMVSYAHELESNLQPNEELNMEEVERALLHEFSRCIGQIVDNAKEVMGVRQRP